jgi:anti-sigma B factor antagonist
MYEPGEVDVALEDGLSMVRLLGEHDLSTQQTLAAKLAGLIETGDPLVVDVTRATFIDSSVITAVVRARNALAARKVPVAIVVPESAPSGVRKLIDLVTANDKEWLIARTPDEARNLVAARQEG